METYSFSSSKSTKESKMQLLQDETLEHDKPLLMEKKMPKYQPILEKKEKMEEAFPLAAIPIILQALSAVPSVIETAKAVKGNDPKKAQAKAKTMLNKSADDIANTLKNSESPEVQSLVKKIGGTQNTTAAVNAISTIVGYVAAHPELLQKITGKKDQPATAQKTPAEGESKDEGGLTTGVDEMTKGKYRPILTEETLNELNIMGAVGGVAANILSAPLRVAGGTVGGILKNIGTTVASIVGGTMEGAGEVLGTINQKDDAFKKKYASASDDLKKQIENKKLTMDQLKVKAAGADKKDASPETMAAFTIYSALNPAKESAEEKKAEEKPAEPAEAPKAESTITRYKPIVRG